MELVACESADSDWLLWTRGPGESEGIVVEDGTVANEDRDSVDDLLFIGSHSNTYFILNANREGQIYY